MAGVAINLRLSPDKKEALEKRAAEVPYRTLSDLIRELIDKELKRKPAPK